VSPGLVDAGTAVTVSGTAEPGAELELLAYSRPSTTFVVARRGVTGDGRFTFRVTPGTNTRLFVRATGSSGTRSSSSVVVNVRSRVSIAAARTGSRAYRFSGSVLPRRGGVLITVYRGTWSLQRTFTGTGTFPFTARAAANPNNAAGQSGATTVTLR
jgi:hypothetical protein